MASGDTGRPRLVLFGRGYCHLCDDMRAALQSLIADRDVDLVEVDVDDDPDLERRYGERVPVLEANGVELCHYFLDADRVRAYLKEIR